MSVIRVNKTNDYTIMSNYHFKEKEMSLKSKGLLSLMLSLPNNWEYSISGLVKICKENETSIKSSLNELKEFGYLEIIKILPNQSKKGRIEYIYNVYEKPKQEGEKQGVENLGVEFLGVENQGQLNTNKLSIKELNIKDNKEEINKEEKEDVYSIIENEFGRPLSPIEYETIKHWLDENDEEIIRKAIKEASLNSVYNLKYIGKILDNWKKNIRKNKDIIPEWFNNPKGKDEASDEKKKEMEDILKKFGG